MNGKQQTEPSEGTIQTFDCTPTLPDLPIPVELKRLKQWVVWQAETRDGKTTKVPKTLNAQHRMINADVTTPRAWMRYADALYLANEGYIDGIGFVFTETDPYTGIDLDKCCKVTDAGETIKMEPWALEIFNELNSYSEISPSRAGVHVIVKGKLPSVGNRKGQVEMYDHDRFFCMTGEIVPGSVPTIEDRQKELDRLHSKLFTKPEQPKPATMKAPVNLEDEELIAKAKASANGAKFSALISGTVSGHTSRSEADLALCSILAFWTGCDRDRMDRLYRQSGLMRDKWDTKRGDTTYGRQTIEKAIAGTTETFSPSPEVKIGSAPEEKQATATVSKAWPVMANEAFYGLAGEFVRAIDPYTEADKGAVLLHLLAMFGNIIGDGPHAVVGADVHPARINVVLVGPTSVARKTSASRPVRVVLRRCDALWDDDRVRPGLSSGEGLIYHVRDADGKDEGVTDKRLVAYEAEFSSTLRVMGREGNSLSGVLRTSWDDGNLSTLTKNLPLRATGAHITMIGHTTSEELLRYLDATEKASGFANRILWCLVRRSKLLPRGDPIPEEILSEFGAKFSTRIEWARQRRVARRDELAEELWETVYGRLTAERPGLSGAMLNRAEAQTLRLSLIYALLENSELIRTPHVQAALAVWECCQESVYYIFGDRTGNPVADRILDELKSRDEISKEEITHLFSRHRVDEIDGALEMLERTGRIAKESRPTKGRPLTVYCLAKKAKKAN